MSIHCEGASGSTKACRNKRTGLQVMMRYLWSHLTPWLEKDVDIALERPDVEALRQDPYVGFHIRRGDKVVENGEANKVETKVMLK